LNAIKLKLLDPEMKNFQNSMQKMQRSGDFEGMKQARTSFQALRDKYGISTAMPLFSLLQVLY
jgi:YidC/Oxa1 family membrane protein insertase